MSDTLSFLKWLIIFTIFCVVGYILYKIYDAAKTLGGSISDTIAGIPTMLSQKWEQTKTAVSETVYSAESLEFQRINEIAIQGYADGYAADMEDYEIGLYMSGANPETNYVPAYINYQQPYARLKK